MTELENLKTLVLAPYILKATALIGIRRKVGGNQFRHVMATFTILLDYKYFQDPVLLKAAVLHDIIEDVPYINVFDIEQIDEDGPAVLQLVREVSRKPGEKKTMFLRRLRDEGTESARLLKVADRISNLTDLHLGIFTDTKINHYLDQTERYVLPMAKVLNDNMYRELDDLIAIRRRMLEKFFGENSG